MGIYSNNRFSSTTTMVDYDDCELLAREIE